MVKCAVQTCYNYSEKNEKPISRKFFGFPKDEKQRNIWTILCGKRAKYLQKPRICSDHFEWEILHTLQCRMLGICNEEKKCKCSVPENEIPTLKIPESVEVLKILNEHAKQKSVKQQYRDRKQIVNELLYRSQ
jgi:hypothetical protein